MAARRLLVLLLVALVASTLGAALIAPPREGEPEREPNPATAGARAEPAPAGAGRLAEAELSSSGRKPETLRLRSGDQLALTVRSRVGAQVEIPAFGLTEDAGPGAPARFDLLLSSTGSFPVRVLGAGRVVGTIEVRRRGPSTSHRDRPAGAG